ncbi:MspI family type II restriction endonuclease [Lactobacillus intestinalis]|uniref:MspI family type II restriction endonuclease n=1 Tax=Lactobacillus intestinalis TaxID=151781 RepID=UPI0025A98C51|nr:MspI family type II restriction endonuclease [Lactobacillus intestinalis]
MESSNGERALAGVNTSKELISLLESIVEKYDTLTLDKNIEYGEKGKDPKQFKANAKINFDKGNSIWLVDVSSSFRSDRIKGKEFDIEHLKKIFQNLGIDVKAYFILPDNAKEKDIKDLRVFEQHIISKDKVTYFDGAMLMSNFRNLLEQKATQQIQQGQRSNLLGKSGEEILYQTFNNKNNVEIWNNPNNYITQSSNYSLFKTVVNKLTPEIGKITFSRALNSYDTQELKIVRTATNKTYGMPKTDVIISLSDSHNHLYDFNVSVKQPKSTKRKITVHEGSVERLLNDLKHSLPINSKFNDPKMFNQLSTALIDFQLNGSKAKMDSKNLEFLNTNLSELNKWLIDYFVFGINNSYLNKNQQANTLLIFNPETGNCKVSLVNEAEEALLNIRKATFNTPFSWTYPSKKRGKKIQIKSPTLL